MVWLSGSATTAPLMVCVAATAGVGAERSPAVISEMSRREKARWRSDDAAALAGR